MVPHTCRSESMIYIIIYILHNYTMTLMLKNSLVDNVYIQSSQYSYNNFTITLSKDNKTKLT